MAPRRLYLLLLRLARGGMVLLVVLLMISVLAAVGGMLPLPLLPLRLFVVAWTG